MEKQIRERLGVGIACMACAAAAWWYGDHLAAQAVNDAMQLRGSGVLVGMFGTTGILSVVAAWGAWDWEQRVRRLFDEVQP
jgi:hypothetical protein